MITHTVTRTVARGIFANRSKVLPPRTGLLLYLRTPNGTGAAAGKYVATAGSASIFAALGSDWYTDVATPKALTAAEILALASVNDYHILFSLTKGLAIYDPYTTAQADIDRAHQFYRVSIYADDVPTAFFNGHDTTGMTSYTGGPTYAPDHLGVLRSPGAGLPAIEGMRLATTLADGAVLGPELVVDYSASKWLPQGSNLVSQDGTAVKITYVDSTYGAKLYLQVLNGFLTATPRFGERFLVGFKAKINMGEAKSTVFSDSSSEVFLTTTSLTNAFKDYSVEFTSNDFYSGYIVICFRNLSAGEVVWITDISVKKVITYVSTDLAGAPILPSVERKTRKGNTDFTEFIAGTTFKKYTRTNPATDMPGYLSEPARTNKVTCRKCNPVDTSGLNSYGSSTFSVVDDTAALTAARLIGVCNLGKAYEIKMPAGTAVTISGVVGNTNVHSSSAFVRKISGSGNVGIGIAGSLKSYTSSESYVRVKSENIIPISTDRYLTIIHDGNDTLVARFILPQLEEGPFCTSPICKLADGTDPLTAITRAGTVLTYPTAGKIRSNNMAFRMTVVPRGLYPTAQLSRFFGTLIDGANSFRVFCIGTSNKINIYKTIANKSYSVEHNITGYIEKDVPLELLWCQSSTYGMILTCRKYVNGDWLSWQSPVTNTTEGGKANIPVGTTYQLGSHDSILQHTGNISEFDTLFIPEGITDPLAWAKAQWGLPA